MKTLSELLQDFLDHAKSLNYSRHTLRSYKVNLNRFLRWLESHGVVDPDRLQDEHLHAWAKHICSYVTGRGVPLRPSSINKNMENVRKWLKYLCKHGYCRPGIIDALEYVKEPDLLPTSVLSHDQVKKLLLKIGTDTQFGFRDRAMIETLYSSGVRVSELLYLNVSDVDLKNETALVNGKGNQQRMVPIGKTALRYLRSYIVAIRPFLMQNSDEKALFLNRDGRRMTYERFLHAVRTYTKAAGLDVNVTPHTFRRSCTTELLRCGANMYHVKELLGHKSLNTLRHYAKLTITDLKKTHEKCHPRELESDKKSS
ncbi:MAG: tyrosine-type recombinase/integrase [Bacteroidetes bacterium]|nr:tyrosine-type recombinase/integrase [Bacteroidota bacterium]